MARDYDSQLLESVAVRRRRLRDAMLFGSQRVRRTLDENLGKIFGSIALAAVICAGCVGWSFISHKMAHDGSGTVRSGAPAGRSAASEAVPLAQAGHGGALRHAAAYGGGASEVRGSLRGDAQHASGVRAFGTW